MYRLAPTLLLSTLLTNSLAAQTPSARKKPAPPPAGPCIGLISTVGDLLELQNFGFTVFGNEKRDFPIESWGINDLVLQKVSAQLGKKYVVKNLAQAKAPLLAFSKQRRSPFADVEAMLAQLVRQHAAPAKCHRYVVATREAEQIISTPHDVAGIGMGSSERPFGKTLFYTIFTLRVYDGQTFTLIRRQKAVTGESTFLKGLKGPFLEFEKVGYAELIAQAPSSARFKDMARTLVARALDTSLPALRILD
jgi:hypothetical protein